MTATVDTRRRERTASPSPLETPDAVISGSVLGYGRPLGLNGPSWLRRTFRRLRGRPPITQRFLLHIVYRNNAERFEVVHFEQPKVSVRDFVGRLLEAPTVRSVKCAELLIKGRKSFGSDYDPAGWLWEPPVSAKPSEPTT